MAKKAPTAKKPVAAAKPANGGQQLIDAIRTAKRLHEFMAGHGGLPQALDAVDKVQALIALTGGVSELKQALEIVAQEACCAAPQ